MTGSKIEAGLPRWDLEVFYPSVDSPELDAALEDFSVRIAALERAFDRFGIGTETAGLGASDAAAFDSLVTLFDGALQLLELLSSFLNASMTVDTRDERAQVAWSRFEQAVVPLNKLAPRLTDWLGKVDLAQLLATSEAAHDHRFLIERARVDAEHLLTPPEEQLIAELRATGGNAWSRLYDNVASQATSTMTLGGKTTTISMPELRLLAYDADRATRRAAYEAELAGWEANATPIAAALNSIKGEAQTVLDRRRWNSALDRALFVNAIDRDVLDAMFTAARESFPDFRRYLHAKALLVGVESLPWYDLFAPVGSSSRAWSYPESTEIVAEAFDTFSDRLGGLARRAYTERWIDVPAAPGKSDGAYCSGFTPGVSRVLMNWIDSYSSLSTLAHELGHAYHNLCLERRTALQRDTPATLAETASIFAETVVRHAVMRTIDEHDELVVLEGVLLDATQVIVDISSRFQFEQAVFAARQEHEVPASELCAIMRQSQLDTYGDGLDPELLHPYMWAAKGHYYSVEHGYYNFPYMFGLLFALGLYRRYLDEPTGFGARYDELLSATAMADAPTLGARFGIDLRDAGFWRSSLDLVRQDVDRYVELAERASCL